MSVRRPIVLTLVLVSAGAAAAVFAFGRGGPRSAASRAETETTASVAEPAPGAGAGESDEVRHLRAELRTKDGLIRALTTQAAARDTERAAVVSAAVRDATRSPMARATALLDARLEGAPANVAAKAELEQALRLEPKVLGSARVDDLRCAGRLCRIALSAATDTELQPAVNALTERIPKGFAATNVFPTGEGAQTIFLGRSGDDLAVDAPPALP